MILRKRLTAMLLVIGMTAGVIGVGASGVTVPKETEESLFGGKKDTIYFWYTDDALSDYVNSAAVNFGEANDVRVIPVLKSGREYVEAVNYASLHDEEQMPDVYLLSNDSLGKAYLAGLAAEIKDSPVCTPEVFPQSALSAVTYDGKIIAYPYYFETSAYLYNKTYLEDFVKERLKEEAGAGAEGEEAEEAAEFSVPQEQLEASVQELLPQTMDELLSFAAAYIAPEAVESILKWDVSDIFYNYYFIGQYMVVGGEAGDDENQIDIYNLESIECLKVYQKLNQFFYIEPDMVTYDSVLQDFIDGKVVFSVVTNDAIARLEEAGEDGSFPFEYGIMTVPRISEALAGRSLSVTNAVVVNGYSGQQELANRFATYLTTEYLDNFYTRTGKTASSYHAAYENFWLNAFRSEYEKSIPMPKMIETSNFWIQLEILFSRVWNGENINDLVRGLSEQMMTQILGQPFTEEYIEEPQTEPEEEEEYIDDGETMDDGEVTNQ